MTPLCFLDMDGVLADFAGGVSKAHNRPSPYLEPSSLGIFDMEKLWGMTPAEFWVGTRQEGFWLGLEKMPDADAIVDLVCSYFGAENVAILTSPSFDPHCIPEKQQWIKQYYPQFYSNMLFGSAKRFLAGPGRVLLDDRDANIDNFRNAGGYAITVPRLWNVGWPQSDHTMKGLEKELRLYWKRITLDSPQVHGC